MLDKQTHMLFFQISLFLIAAGVILTYPSTYNYELVAEQLAIYKDIIWKPLALAAVFLIVAKLTSNKHSKTSILIGYLGFFSLLFPVMFLLKGLPEDLGLAALLFFIGLMTFFSIASLFCSNILFNKNFFNPSERIEVENPHEI